MSESFSSPSQDIPPAPDSGIGGPRVSVIIVSWNALEVVQRCLPSVVRTAYPNLEIVFADNASTDGTAQWITSNFPSVHIVRHPENWAFCKGNNAAVPHATGKYLVLLNNDVEVPPDWLDGLVDTLELDATIGAVQPKMLDYSNRTRFEYAGAAGGFLDRFGYPFARGRLFFDVEEDRGQYDDPIDIFWASGAALMTRRTLFEALGGLDDRFVMHMEEIDYCWRLQRRGLRIVCQPSSHVYHVGGASLKQGSAEKVFLNYRNNLLVLFKNLPKQIWWRVLASRVALDALGVLRALFLVRPAESFAIVRAYWAARKMRDLFLSDRPGANDKPVLPTYRGSIVLDFFVRQRRTFRQLPEKRFGAGA